MDYIPKKDSEKAIWNTHLSAKIETDGALLGLTPDEIIQYKAICTANAAYISEEDGVRFCKWSLYCSYNYR